MAGKRLRTAVCPPLSPSSNWRGESEKRLKEKLKESSRRETHEIGNPYSKMALPGTTLGKSWTREKVRGGRELRRATSY